MVNDEKGISDPRELIVDKGRAFIPQGKDVVLPLSKGAKVYTASQTKAIMSGMGIPHYATGKDNSDAFTSAKDDWTHYTKTHAVTTAQELEKWLEFQEKFKSNDKDIADIEEQIFSIMQKQTKEFNEQSKAYLEKHSAINDWGDNGDTPLDAFKRIKDRNYQDLQDAKITWDDYVDNVSDAGETLYDDMKSYSDSWLEHQQKYHDMSIDDYIAGIDREAERLEEFYANDVINYQKYVEEKQTLEEKRYDAVAQKNADEYSTWQKDADAWQELRNTYDDWDKYGDSEEDFLKRKIDRVKSFTMRVKSVLRNLLTTQTSTAWNCTSRNQVRLTNCSKSNKTIFQMSKTNFQSKSKNFVTVGTYRIAKQICQRYRHNLMCTQIQLLIRGNRSTKSCRNK